MSDDKKKQESLYSRDLFNDEMEMINNEIENLDDLYSELKGHFDSIKNSQARGSLSFIKDQTSNLIAIKTAKLNYIKQKADMKKNTTDFAFKEKTLSSKETEEGVDSLTAEILKKIANEVKYVQNDNKQNSVDVTSHNEDDIDKLYVPPSSKTILSPSHGGVTASTKSGNIAAAVPTMHLSFIFPLIFCLLVVFKITIPFSTRTRRCRRDLRATRTRRRPWRRTCRKSARSPCRSAAQRNAAKRGRR